MAALYDRTSGTRPSDCMSASRESATGQRLSLAHARIAALYVTTVGATPRACICWNSASARLGCPPRSHAARADAYVYASGRPSSIDSSSRNDTCHCPARLAALISVFSRLLPLAAPVACGEGGVVARGVGDDAIRRHVGEERERDRPVQRRRARANRRGVHLESRIEAVRLHALQRRQGLRAVPAPAVRTDCLQVTRSVFITLLEKRQRFAPALLAVQFAHPPRPLLRACRGSMFCATHGSHPHSSMASPCARSSSTAPGVSATCEREH
eukprot:1228620-Pleurochrysis_carterae.AAC.3